jgi:hypothetical protein
VAGADVEEDLEELVRGTRSARTHGMAGPGNRRRDSHEEGVPISVEK